MVDPESNSKQPGEPSTITECVKKCQTTPRAFAIIYMKACYCVNEFRKTVDGATGPTTVAPDESFTCFDKSAWRCPGDDSESCGSETAALVFRVCPSGSHKAMCTSPCSTLCGAGCFGLAGSCLTVCSPGYVISSDSSTCNTCSSDKYGANCFFSCSASGRCKDGCEGNGRCKGGASSCAPGHKGPHCLTSCFPGKYGSDCQNSCSDKCIGQLCDHITGNCEQCGKGKWGNMCENTCSSTCLNSECYPKNGTCINCLDTKWGDQCENACSTNCEDSLCDPLTGNCIKCSEKKWGSQCENPCNTNCIGQTCKATDGYCLDGCKDGFYGDECESNCPNNCVSTACVRETGNCPSCAAGYYGVKCSSPCPQNCKDGKCGQQDGICKGCEPGYFGDRCTSNCSGNCKDDECDQSNGVCIECEPGYHGASCDEKCLDNCGPKGCFNASHCDGCKAGYVGAKCDRECDNDGERNCTDAGCEQYSGQCFACQPGYCFQISKFCDYPCPSTTPMPTTTTTTRMYDPTTAIATAGGPNIVPIAAGAAGGLVVIIVIIVVIIIFVRRRQRNAQSSEKPITVENGTNGQNNHYIPDGNNVESPYEDVTPKVAPSVTTDPPKERPPAVLPPGPPPATDHKPDVIPGSPPQPPPVISIPDSDKSPKSVKKKGKTKKEKDKPKSGPKPAVAPPQPAAVAARPATGSLYEDADGKAIKVDNLAAYIDSQGEAGLTKEYKGLNNTKKPWKRAEKAMAKNRYKGLWAYDHTRVVLPPDPSDPDADYINANYMPDYENEKAFIAAQGPTANTVNDFWRMIWHENCNTIVVLAKVQEQGRTKFAEYWPASGLRSAFGDIWVTTEEENNLTDYTIRKLKAEMDGVVREVLVFHFLVWPDQGIPTTAAPLLNVLRKVRKRSGAGRGGGPVIVHCSAGIGRTGTYIALDMLLQQAKDKDEVDVRGAVNRLRDARVQMVQTAEQYIFLYHALLEGTTLGQTTIPVEYFDFFMKTGELNDFEKVKKQFEMLERIKPKLTETDIARAISDEHVSKNRVRNIVSAGIHQVVLKTPVDGDDYINAVWVNGYSRTHAFMVTQVPLPSTVADLWTLVWDYRPSTIVLLGDKTEPALATPWVAHHSHPLRTGRFLLTVASTTMLHRSLCHLNVHQADVPVTSGEDGSGEPLYYNYGDAVNQQQAEDDEVYKNSQDAQGEGHYVDIYWVQTLDPKTLVQAHREVAARERDDAPVLVMCSDGAHQSGVYVAAHALLQQAAVEREVDVFDAVRQARATRPHFITDVKQLQLVYNVIGEYLSSQK